MKRLIFILWFFALTVHGKEVGEEWYRKMKVRGYAQFRYNRLLETNDELICRSCDTSLGKNQGFSLRRTRLILSGDISERVYLYFQPDFSSDSSTTSSSGSETQKYYVSLQDGYFDYALNPEKSWRIRSGISKVPFDFENLQSSRLRAAFDRSDMNNSANPNVRDIGIFFMQVSPGMRERFEYLTKDNLKGSGDYGNLAFGFYNGQGSNRPEKNNELHRVIRYTYPYRFQNGQFLEGSIQAYEGRFNTTDEKNHYDARTGISLILYPRPFGIQAEYNIGRGPAYDVDENKIRSLPLKGGYVQLSYQLYQGNNSYSPYIRFQNYDGGNKQDDGAPSNKMSEWEIGAEWQPNKVFELTAAYVFSDRLTQSDPVNRDHERGELLRLQAQFNY